MLLINIKYNKILIFFFLIFNFLKVTAKDYDGKLFICADEVGPRFELEIPKFIDKENLQEISFKVFELTNRDIFYLSEGTIKKKSSPIDRSYFYYSVDFHDKKKDSKKEYFELFPPSHLKLKNQGISFSSLVCW